MPGRNGAATMAQEYPILAAFSPAALFAELVADGDRENVLEVPRGRLFGVDAVFETSGI